jgi:hypothetical protein
MFSTRHRRRRRRLRPVPMIRLHLSFPQPLSPSRSPRKRRRRAIAYLITAAAMVYVIVIAMWAKAMADRTGNSATRSVQQPSGPFVGSANVMMQSFDRSQSTVHIETTLTLIGTHPKYDIHDYSFSAFRNTDRSRSDWTNKKGKEPAGQPASAKLEKFDFYGETGPARLTKVVDRVTADIAAEVERSDAWFPFDRWRITLRPKACVDDRQGGCLTPNAQVRFTNLVVRASDPYRLGERIVLRKIEETADGGMVVAVERQPFVRVLMVIFLSIGVAYVVYLVRFEEPKEFVVKSLGLFAALMGFRSLLVPQQVLAFPTLIDFCVSAIAVGSFALALYKFERKGAA